MKPSFKLAGLLFLLMTVLLKISGLLRDMVIAFYFGDSYQADAFLAAFIIPNMLFLFLNTGMKNTLVPSYIEAEEKNQGHSHLTQIFKGTAGISMIIGVVGAISSPVVIPLIYSDFHHEAETIAVWVAVILFSSMLFIGANAVLEAYFDARNQFSFTVISQLIVIGSTISSALLFARTIGPYSLAAGYMAGVILSLFFKLTQILPKKVIHFQEKIKLKEIQSFYIVFLPVALTVMVGQINLTVDNIFASKLEVGAITYINYAKNLAHFPQAIFGVTIATIVFPILTKAKVKKDKQLFKQAIEQGTASMYFVLLPLISGMMIVMPEVISVLYERGAFTNEATQVTSHVAYFYYGSVLFFSLSTLLNKGFYTLKKGHYILAIGAGSIVLNIILNGLFTKWIGLPGIPLASSVVAFFYISFSFVLLVRLIGKLNYAYLLKEIFKITVASALMMVTLQITSSYFQGFASALYLFLQTGVGVIVYLLLGFGFRIQSLMLLISMIFKRGRKDSEYQKPVHEYK